MSSNRAHFYCWCEKKGSLRRSTNWRPFTEYRVQGQWIEDWWAEDKLSHETYHKLSLRIRKGMPPGNEIWKRCRQTSVKLGLMGKSNL